MVTDVDGSSSMGGSDWDFSKYVEVSSEKYTNPSEPGGATSRVTTARPDYVFAEDDSTGAGSELVIGKPPFGWLLACMALVVLGGAVAVTLGANPTSAVVAWVISGPLAIGLLAAFTTSDTRARASGIYARRGWVRPCYVACVVLCGVAVCLAALRIALWVGRL